MELEKIEILKELIKKRDTLLNDLDSIKNNTGFSPQHIVFEWDSGYTLGISVPFGAYETIREFYDDLLSKELDAVNNWILKL